MKGGKEEWEGERGGGREEVVVKSYGRNGLCDDRWKSITDEIRRERDKLEN